MYLFYMDSVQLPVAPSALQLKIKNQNKTMVLINEGEINILKSPGLTEISFTCLLPNVKYPFAKYPKKFQKGEYYLSLFEKLKVTRKPFSFVVARTVNGKAKIGSNTSFDVTLEDYTIKEDADEGFDFSVDITLKQYKPFGTKIIVFKKKAATTKVDVKKQRDVKKTPSKTHTVKKGDTLWGIAKTKLGKGTRYKEIYSLNKNVIEAAAKKHGKKSSSNGHWIYPGTVLKIP